MFVVAIIAAALALPVTVYFERDANTRLVGLKLARAQLEAQQREIADYHQHLVRFREYADQLDDFVRAARHKLTSFLDDMRHGPDSFFVPTRAQLEMRPTINREEAASRRGNGEMEPDPGGVVLTLEGEFLVRR